MRIDEGRNIGGRIGWNLVLYGAKIRECSGNRLVETFDFLFDLRFLQYVLGYLHDTARDDVQLADGNTPGGADTVK